MRIRLFATGSLVVGGLILIGLGLYFAFLRPSLLPEDARYMGASVAQIQIAIPGLHSWLARVFSVLGGYMVAAGVLTVYVAVTGFRTGTPGASPIVAVSWFASIGWMAITNFLIDSDFKWLLLLFTTPWAVALLLLAAARFTWKFQAAK